MISLTITLLLVCAFIVDETFHFVATLQRTPVTHEPPVPVEPPPTETPRRTGPSLRRNCVIRPLMNDLRNTTPEERWQHERRMSFPELAR